MLIFVARVHQSHTSEDHQHRDPREDAHRFGSERPSEKYGDDWHYAHHWDPRLVVPDSIMPSFKWLYTRVRVAVLKTDAGPALAPAPEGGGQKLIYDRLDSPKAPGIIAR